MVAILLSLAFLLLPISAWGWGSQGHEIVAVIAADNLTPEARSHVAKILGVPSDQRAVAEAMARASVLPDTKFKEMDSRTKPWHFIDLCLQNPRADFSTECPAGNCVTAKIDEYSKRLSEGNSDRWGANGDLAFLIHFLGDIHQPLHAANNADRGGNCVAVDGRSSDANLHLAWDNTVVQGLAYSIDSGRVEPTAHRLEQKYANEKTTDAWAAGHTDDIALESNQLAVAEIYRALKIPVEPCDAQDRGGCSALPIHLSTAYLDHSEEVAGHQLAKAGFRLASLLNQMWTQPVAASDLSHPASITTPMEGISSASLGGPIVGNRKSKIFAWPGCGTYDMMAPSNRVVFASREAAQQAGYRAAYNCP